MLGLDPVRDADRLRPQIGSQLQSVGPSRPAPGLARRSPCSPGRVPTDGDRLLEQFGLAHKRRSPYAGMSGGERQRLFLVLALLNRPRLVILDELTQGLDPAARREVWSAVAQLRDAGTTVLLVTHELDEAEALCDRVVAMRDGRVLDQGTPAELVARHAARGHGPVRACPTTPTCRSPQTTLQALNRLPGVAGVPASDGQVAVRGTREAIAHVGAWLVDSRPPDPARPPGRHPRPRGRPAHPARRADHQTPTGSTRQLMTAIADLADTRHLSQRTRPPTSRRPRRPAPGHRSRTRPAACSPPSSGCSPATRSR